MNIFTQKFFQTLSLTTFAMSTYNTLKNKGNAEVTESLSQKFDGSAEITRKSIEEIERSYTINSNEYLESLQYENKCKELTNQLENSNNLANEFINYVKEIIEKSDMNNFIGNNVFDINILNMLDKLTLEQNLAIVHISGAITIFFSLLSIINIFYGNFFIKYFNLIERFPKIVNLINLRQKFQHYYLWVNFLIIIFVLLGELIVNIYILLT